MTIKADTRLRRLPERGSKDLQLAFDIIDSSRLCHVGFTIDEQPYVVPMAVGRDGEQILLHGSVVSRLMKNLAEGLPCCVTITHLDGLVLARSSFNSSMNYRSLMAFGIARLVSDEAEKNRGLDILVEHLAPGRLADLRPSSRKELNATTLLTLPLKTFSIKSRNGPPGDAKGDLDTPIWAGVIPLTLTEGQPIPAPDMPVNIRLPYYLQYKNRSLIPSYFCRANPAIEATFDTNPIHNPLKLCITYTFIVHYLYTFDLTAKCELFTPP